MDQQKLDSIGSAFMNHYYGTFDNPAARANLAGLYQDASVMSYEGKSFQGRQNIMTHLTTGVKFATVQHIVKSMDVQHTGAGLLVCVTGDLKVDGGENPLKFSQTFHLLPTDAAASNFWVRNDVFRLNYG